MKLAITLTAACAFAATVAGCGDNIDTCGDLVCGQNETAASCAADCGCGNGIANPGEDCDGTDLGTATCESVVQRGGKLACKDDCTFEVAACNVFICGNALAEPGEECDGSDLGGATCASAGFSGGAVTCRSNCRLDVGACCNNFCAAANTSVCVGNTAQTCVMQANGCLGLEIADCAAADDVCDDSNGTATCKCVDRCSGAGVGHCTGTVAETCEVQADGCLAFTANVDCSTSGEACAIGPQGSTCVPISTGENCADPYPLENGLNVIAWTASVADYVTATSQTSCNTTSFAGPDLVLAYTATSDGIVTFSMSKQANQRHVLVVSSATCGTVTAATDITCVADSTLTAMGDTFAVTTGTTYYFYVRDTTSGTATLPSPLVLDVDEAACAGLANDATNLSPADGAVLATKSPVLSFELPHPVKTDVGVITITGDLGTSRSFDLATAPSQVTFANGGRRVQISPGSSFQPGETVTVSWSGLVDQFCGAAIAPPAWTFHIMTPSCTPGVGGMVGSSFTRVPTGIASFTEMYVAADNAPNGYVYVGGTTDLFRVPKAGGSNENVVTLANITGTQLGNAMAIVGSRIFTLDTVTAATTPFLWRLSASGGVNWNPLGYGRYPVTAGASPSAMFEYKGRIYIATNETTTTDATEIWSVSASAISLPAPAVLEGRVTSEIDCDGLTGDDKYFYLTCDNSNDHIIRVDRTTFQSELITTAIPISLTKNELHAHDFDGDGSADALYVKTEDETVRYICGPAAASGPFWQDILVDFGTSTTTGNFGLGFDRSANALWAFDDDTRELILIQ